ncbi:MAG: hypothetical protein HXS41_11910 [Theionarchaea archaeon]|nr:hypothetical protein [Theionarchaea archaeon]MBU7001394.1 hypothetical protein [Theionarchaea archaeon]MBU7021755.1 hypothetical protein [Theionarchaea archaeon]MBU7034503.1 hypothetical protein [Theionarchaea archaeon]MBU7040800.1 hypothetical protein [Theionarchaea archaeon]
MSPPSRSYTGPRFLLKKSFTSDDLAAGDGYTAFKWFYSRGKETIPRRNDHFIVYVTARTSRGSWFKAQVSIPVTFGEPWRESLKQRIEHELRTNLDLMGVFLSDYDVEWARGFQLSWED